MSLLNVIQLKTEISSAEEALIVEAVLKRWADPKGGFVKILANQAHLWEELPVASDKPRIFVICLGEVPRGSFEDSDSLHRVDRNWMLVVVRGHGFKNVVAKPLGNSIEWLVALEQIRDLVRTILNISQEFPIHYKGTNPLPSVAPTPSANVFLDASAIEYSTAHDIPAVTITAPAQMTLPTQTPMP